MHPLEPERIDLAHYQVPDVVAPSSNFFFLPPQPRFPFQPPHSPNFLSCRPSPIFLSCGAALSIGLFPYPIFLIIDNYYIVAGRRRHVRLHVGLYSGAEGSGAPW